MRVDEIMSRSVRSVRPDDCGGDAARIMWDRDCGFVPVVDDAGSIVGTVTDRDLCMAAYTRGVPLSYIRIDSVMSRGVRTCLVSDSFEVAERIMAEAQVRRLPVTNDGGALVGIVSLGDLARAREATAARRLKGHVTSDISRTLAAITQPRDGAAISTASA